jgi:hypothetical protein
LRRRGHVGTPGRPNGPNTLWLVSAASPITFRALKRDISRRKRELAPVVAEYGTLLRMLEAIDESPARGPRRGYPRRGKREQVKHGERHRVVRLDDALTWPEAVLADRIELDDEQAELLRAGTTSRR